MFDVEMRSSPGPLGTPDSLARLKKRRRAEWRLKAYGIIAMALALAALAALAWSVVTKTSAALTEHYIVLEAELPVEEVDPDRTGDSGVIGAADFVGITRNILKSRFSHVQGRKARRQLYDIVSVGAAFELRQHAMANPSVVGSSTVFSFLASDVADLYFKGVYGRLDELPKPDGVAITVTANGKGRWSILAEQPVFGGVVQSLGHVLLDRSERLQNQAALHESGRQVFEDQFRTAETQEKREEFRRRADSSAARRDKLLDDARELVDMARSDSRPIQLDSAMPSLVLKVGAGWYRLEEVLSDRAVITSLAASGAPPDRAVGGEWSFFVNEVPEARRKVSDLQAVLLDDLEREGAVRQAINWRFFTSGDSREPELAGILGAVSGSFWTMIVTFVLAFPVGVLAAVYLEEFAPRNRWTDLIEVNINNLAAVPSIVFGLLALSVFLGFFGLPRSAPVAGGVALALMTLPTIIIASRAAIAAVPPSIRDAALGVGASRLQTSFHHVLPLALPGILTGTIIGMAQALGETAPLIMIGMVAFIVDIPGGITESATALPVQVFRWSDLPERAFEARTAAAICVLLVFLVLMNALAVFLRRRFERRW